MDGSESNALTRTRFQHLPYLIGTVSLLYGPLALCAARGADFHEPFDAGETSWRVIVDQSKAQVRGHERQTAVFQSGTGSEHVALHTAGAGVPVLLEHPLEAARVLEELKVSLQFRASRPGARLYLCVVFPHEENPETGEPLSALLPGEEYSKPGYWQPLTCTTTDKQLRDLTQRLRQRLNKPVLNLDEAYVDRAYLALKIPAGETELHLDELRLAPVVAPRDTIVVAAATAESSESFPVEFRLGRLVLNGAPFFPRITPYHGEPLEILQFTGVDVVWIPDCEDHELLADLRRHDLWATAAPPRAASADGKVLDVADVSMLPFSEKTRSILFWNLGTRVPADKRDSLIALRDQTRAADRSYKRPLMVDIIAGQERTVSRDVDLLAVSRHVCNTTFDLKQYRNWLIQRRMLAQQGQFLWTWIQTEPASNVAERRAAARNHPVVTEPEQIRLQLYSALAAGCRGIGFYKSTPIGSGGPGDLERQLIISQLNLELELLEPWLATGDVKGQVQFQVAPKPVAPITRKSIDFQNSPAAARERDALLREWQNRQRRTTQIGTELEAAIIQSEYGTLLLPIWYESDAQFVPGQMVANDATITVPGVPETASAYEITTTEIRPVVATDQRRVTGGLKIVLPRFDQTAAVLVTSDRTVIDRLRQKQAELADKSARVSVELARAKLDRVRRVDAELQALGMGLFDGTDLLAGAQFRADAAAQSLAHSDFHTARERANEAMQFLRILQRAHWDDAVRNLTSPVASPHTVCFQTLPDHWELVSRLQHSLSETAPNRLASGNFEDIESMLEVGWQHKQNQIEHVHANADFPAGKEGQYALRMFAGPQPGHDPPLVLPHPPVIVNAPPVAVRRGQIVHVSGWVRVGVPITGSLDGAMLYDSIAGPAGALRWRTAGDWQHFGYLREVPEDGELMLTLVLNGLGEIRFDDLRIVAYDPVAAPALPPVASEPDRGPFSPLQLLERLPRLPRRTWDWSR